jgi:hypothetical protein
MKGKAPPIRDEEDGPQTAGRPDVRPERGTRLARWLRPHFYACGEEGPPAQIEVDGTSYTLKQVLKHDFWAATALYEATGDTAGRPRAVVYKRNRRRHFGLIPVGWLGRLVAHNELCNLGRCAGIDGVPKVLARPNATTYCYEYIEGTSLCKGLVLPADFFEQLRAVLDQVHARRLVHLDLHKPDNILLGRDGRPYIIDLQVSAYLPDRLLISRKLSARFRRWLQSFDVYHLYKHKRRLMPERLTEAERRLSYNRSLALVLHRAIAAPYKWVRRAILRHLFSSGVLKNTPTAVANPETDPNRWTKRQHRPGPIPIREAPRRRSGAPDITSTPFATPTPSKKRPDL